MSFFSDAISAALDFLPPAIRTPEVAAKGIGGLFVVAGAYKVAVPAAEAAAIKETMFYSFASSPKFRGLSLARGNNLLHFTRLIGATMATSGAAFASGCERKYSSMTIASFLALFNIFVHVNLSAPLKTGRGQMVHFTVNSLIAYGALSVGGWTGGGQKALEKP